MPVDTTTAPVCLQARVVVRGKVHAMDAECPAWVGPFLVLVIMAWSWLVSVLKSSRFERLLVSVTTSVRALVAEHQLREEEGLATFMVEGGEEGNTVDSDSYNFHSITSTPRGSGRSLNAHRASAFNDLEEQADSLGHDKTETSGVWGGMLHSSRNGSTEPEENGMRRNSSTAKLTVFGLLMAANKSAEDAEELERKGDGDDCGRGTGRDGEGDDFGEDGACGTGRACEGDDFGEDCACSVGAAVDHDNGGHDGNGGDDACSAVEFSASGCKDEQAEAEITRLPSSRSSSISDSSSSFGSLSCTARTSPIVCEGAEGPRAAYHILPQTSDPQDRRSPESTIG